MLPKNDATSRDKLTAYLIEWTGGPALYSAERGHPRLRMRHAPFEIGPDEVETWLLCFGQSLDANNVHGQIREFLDTRVTALAHHMQNTD
jgi:hemoglobin